MGQSIERKILKRMENTTESTQDQKRLVDPIKYDRIKRKKKRQRKKQDETNKNKKKAKTKQRRVACVLSSYCTNHIGYVDR